MAIIIKVKDAPENNRDFPHKIEISTMKRFQRQLERASREHGMTVEKYVEVVLKDAVKV